MSEIKLIRDASYDDLTDFSKVVEPVLDYIKKYWTGAMTPKDYEERTKDYEDYHQIPIEDDLEYNGLSSYHASHSSIEHQLHISQVAYSDVGQGRKPTETLINSLISFGMDIGRERTKREFMEEANSIERNLRIDMKRIKDKIDKGETVTDSDIRSLGITIDNFQFFKHIR